MAIDNEKRIGVFVDPSQCQSLPPSEEKLICEAPPTSSYTDASIPKLPALCAQSFPVGPLRKIALQSTWQSLEKPPKEKETTIYQSSGTHDGEAYTVRLQLAKNVCTPDEANALLDTMMELNTYMKYPVDTAVWYNGSQLHENCLSAFGHLVLYAGKIRLKSIVVHEMGHGIYLRGTGSVSFWRGSGNEYIDQGWTTVYRYGLVERNYQIIDDSNYEKNSNEDIGHPYSDPNETFASSVHAYYGYPEQFLHYINDPETSDTQRLMGKMVWCFMRDKVFKGKVFTCDGQDPFLCENFESLKVQAEQQLVPLLQKVLTDIPKATSIWDRSEDVQVRHNAQETLDELDVEAEIE